MRALLVILLLGVLGAPPGLARPGPAKGPMLGVKIRSLAGANALMQRGQVRKAILVYRGLLDKDPHDDQVRLGLALAVTQLWNCAEPLSILADLRGGALWSAPAADAQARCLAISGDLDGATAAAEEAWILDPGPGEAIERAAVALQDRDPLAVEAAVDDLTAFPGTDLEVAELRTWAGVEFGAKDADERIDDLRRLATGDPGAGEARLVASLADGWRWLDVDDPPRALAVLRKMAWHARLDPRLGAWVAEAARRAGDVDLALAVQDRNGMRKAHGALVDSVRARIFADAGKMDQAQAVLAPLAGSEDVEVLASQWYLARARGDEAAMKEYGAQWAARNRTPGRTLDQLVPIDRRGGTG